MNLPGADLLSIPLIAAAVNATLAVLCRTPWRQAMHELWWTTVASCLVVLIIWQVRP